MSLALVMNHSLGLGFQVGTRLHISKSKSDFPCLSLLGSDTKPSSLSLINGSLVFTECSLFSLLSIDFKTSPFYFETSAHFPLHQNVCCLAGCCCRRLTAHLTPLSSLHGSSQALRLGFLVSDQVKKISLFISLFRYFVFVIWVYFLFKWFIFWYVIRIIWKQLKGSFLNDLKLKD